MPNNTSNSEEQKEMKNGKTCPCGCGNCGCGMVSGGYGMRGWGRGSGILAILIGIVVLLLVFWVGVHVGEFHNEFRGMMMRGSYGGGYGRMMVNPGGPIRGVIPPTPVNATSSIQ
jgi:hypothetical protein